MVELDGNLTFRWLVEAFKSRFKRVGLGFVQNLQPNDLVRLSIARHVEVRHGARHGLTQNFISLGDIDFAAFEQPEYLVNELRTAFRQLR